MQTHTAAHCCTRTVSAWREVAQATVAASTVTVIGGIRERMGERQAYDCALGKCETEASANVHLLRCYSAYPHHREPRLCAAMH